MLSGDNTFSRDGKLDTI